MNKQIKTLMIGLLIVGTAYTSQGQDEDSKIKVKITKTVEGKMPTFERECSHAKVECSHVKEMRTGKKCHKFASDSSGFDRHLGMHHSGMRRIERMIELNEGDSTQVFSSSFEDNDFPKHHMKCLQLHGGGQNGLWFSDDEAVFDFKMFDSEEYEKKLEEKMAELKEKLKGLDKKLQEDIMDAFKEIEEMSSGVFPRKIKQGGSSIEEVGDDFEKRGKVKEKNKLDAGDMNLRIINKRLTLRFRVKEAGEFTVKISNESGKAIYSRYFEEFEGTFSDTINFSNYSEGKYLFEILKDEKRLTKKIIID